jgi:hypothetical protein
MAYMGQIRKGGTQSLLIFIEGTGSILRVRGLMMGKMGMMSQGMTTRETDV